MAFNHTLSAILRGRWLIDKQWADDHMMMVVGMLKGNSVNVAGFKGRAIELGIKLYQGESGYEGVMLPVIIDPNTLEVYRSYAWVSGSYIPNPNIPPNSVAVIQVTGPITKYNGECGEPGSIQLGQYISELSRRDNIGSILLVVDTPGGEARAANEFVTAIQKSQKPVLAYIKGMSASLGVWLTSACKEVYFSYKFDQLGSIGAYWSIVDFSAMLEMAGIKIHEVYAPQSTDKNKNYRDAIEGDYSLIQDELKILVNEFTAVVAARSDTAQRTVDQWGSGKMFFADEAVKLGLADGIIPFEKVLKRAALLGRLKLKSNP